jgi:sphingomyelin phosphodiesterase acid-like 3
VLFSTKARAKAEKKAALLQLQWLHSQLLLSQQQHQHVILAFHIPMGIDVFATLKHLLEVTDFWQTSYTRQFQGELKEFSQIITAILPAHIHRDTLQLIAMQTYADIPVIITPSISPIYGNDPAFKVLNYDEKSLQMKNIETYTYEINDSEPSWQQRD